MCVERIGKESIDTEAALFWTLLVLLTVAWLLTVVLGIGAPWSWLLSTAAAALLLYRVARSLIGR